MALADVIHMPEQRPERERGGANLVSRSDGWRCPGCSGPGCVCDRLGYGR